MVGMVGDMSSWESYVTELFKGMLPLRKVNRTCIHCEQEKRIMFDRMYYYECFDCITKNAFKRGGK